MYDRDTTILGTDAIAPAAIDAWFAAHNPHAPALGAAILQVAGESGVRAVFLAAQIAEETGDWTSARAVQANNPAGIGSTDDGAWGASFATPAAGIRAEGAHWLTYIMGAANPLKADDPRYDAEMSTGTAGTITTVGQIGGGIWATDPDYAGKVLARMNDLIAFAATLTPAPQPPGGTMHVIDLRDKLATNASGGPRATAAPKLGVVIHYNGPAVTNDAVSQFTIDAAYHCQEDWGGGSRGDGIMYHLGVGDEPADHSPATVYLLRDLDAVLWHCASWVNGGNGNGFSVQVPIGEGQIAGPGQLAALGALVDALRTAGATLITDRGDTIAIPNGNGIARAMVKGHQELSSTSCPGTLMGDFVQPYRAGTDAPPAPASRTFPETGHTVTGDFLDFWNSRGGLDIFGFPLTDVVQESDRPCQYFERNVFELHPENPPQYRVQLRRLGADAAAQAGYSGPGISAVNS